MPSVEGERKGARDAGNARYAKMNRLKLYLRWGSVLPGAALAGWLAWLALQAFNRVTMWSINVDPAFGVGRAYVETLSGLIAGALFTAAGVALAPGHRRRVAFALAGLALLAAGFLALPALIAGDRWTVWNVACAAVAAALAGYVAAERAGRADAAPSAPRDIRSTKALSD